jgi:hypothetical protein
MMNSIIRSMPLAVFLPFRHAIMALNRRNPLRVASTIVVRQASRAFRNRLALRLTEIRPIDEPGLSFDAVDSMVMDAVYWTGVRGYEGTVAGVGRPMQKVEVRAGSGRQHWPVLRPRRQGI